MSELNVIRIIIPNQVNLIEDCHYVYKYHKLASYFVMVIEGNMMLEIGNEKIELIVKPFEYFGINALLGDCTTVDEIVNNTRVYKPYLPEFSLKINYKNYYYSHSKMKSNKYQYATYLKIDRSLWLNAINTTKIKRSAQQQHVLTENLMQTCNYSDNVA